MGKSRFVSNSVFVYPVLIILISYFAPAVLDYYDHFDALKEDIEDPKQIKSDDTGSKTTSKQKTLQ